MTGAVQLAPESIEAIAQRVVALLDERTSLLGAPSLSLVDAATVARALGVSRSTVYAHATRLGARRLTDPGDRRRPRLRFDLDEARAAWVSSAQTSSAPMPAVELKRRRRRGGRRSGPDLLPIRGEAA
jgi:hypothetical protein